MNKPTSARRPIRSRNTYFAAKTTQWLAKLGVKPNYVSLMSIVFALFAAASLAASTHFPGFSASLIFIVATLFILLRLLCNLFDGMLAVECGLGSKSGEIYNDLPDRPADIVILVAAGYAAQLPAAGWLAAILAVMTAYVRLLGATSGAKQCFIGPMAKQHRMAVIISACLLSAFFGWKLDPAWIFGLALGIIILGTIITIIRRLKRIMSSLES